MNVASINWNQLKIAAVAEMKKSYSPYSKFPVGAAALVDDGKVVSGCNVENASYGLSLCAECGLVSNLISSGGGRLIAFICVDSDENFLSPCGRCRQLLYEHGGGDLLLMSVDGPTPLSDLLPWAFGPSNLSQEN